MGRRAFRTDLTRAVGSASNERLDKLAVMMRDQARTISDLATLASTLCEALEEVQERLADLEEFIEEKIHPFDVVEFVTFGSDGRVEIVWFGDDIEIGSGPQRHVELARSVLHSLYEKKLSAQAGP